MGRELCVSDRLSTNNIANYVKRLKLSVCSTGGRNQFGRLTVRGRGGRSWVHSYKLNWLCRILDEPKEVVEIGFDSSRTGRVALGFFKKLGLFEYKLAVEGLVKGKFTVDVKSPYSTIFNRVNNGQLERKGLGNSYPLQTLSVGSQLCAVELVPGGGGKLSRAAGTSLKLLQKFNAGLQTLVAVRLCSGQQKYLHGSCRAVIGQVSNIRHRGRVIGKAGGSRQLGFRPKVRGVAMNPVDHPHGGGEGKTSGGRSSVSPWGWLTKGLKTVTAKKKKSASIVWS